MARLRDFQDIYTAVCEELKVPVTDTVTLARIKRDINIMYIDEIVPHKRWLWLMGNVKEIHKVTLSDGTAAITVGTTTATLSVAPSATLGSFVNYYFSIDGFDEIYDITAHTAGSATITISSAYQGNTVTTSNYKIWTDRVTLPTDLRETVEVYHQRSRGMMEGLGRQEFRKVVNEQRKADDFPAYFNVGEYSGTGESSRFRIMRVHPSITAQPVTINIDYAKEVTELTDDGDEPIMPIEDRVVILYGALSRAWGRERNEERAAYNQQLYMAKLSRMAGKIEDGFDAPKITVNNRYMRSKRGSRLRGVGSRGLEDFGGASSYTPPAYLENVTINGANVTGNITVVSGRTIDGRDISADGAALDSHIASTAEHGATGAVVGTTNTQVLTNKTIATASNSITGTASTIAEFDGSGNLAASAITLTSLAYLTATEGLTSVTLADNQSSAANIATWTAASYDSIYLTYSIKRGSAIKESGIINLATDGTNAAIAVAGAAVGTSGVTFSADVSAGALRLRYVSTSTGTAPTIKYTLQKWLA
jgi:hypothetical protein